MPIRLLAIGDMHLGRPASRLPESLARHAHEYTPIIAWERTVSLAIQRQVDLVVIAGDLVDQEEQLFEAYRPLEMGINRLVERGITVLGVSGNHDVYVLPRLADQLSAFRLLGANGLWETYVHKKSGEEVTIHGWSFPRAVVDESPLSGHVFERGPGFNIGLLHCDLDQSASRYAPVSSDALRAAGLDAWLLGHVHVPSELSKDNCFGYLGSICGLHIGEHGRRGPWLLEINNGRLQELTQWQVAPLAWEQVTLDASKIESPSHATNHLLTELKKCEVTWSKADESPLAAGIRVRLQGETNCASQICDMLLEQQNNNLGVGQTQHVFIESVIDETKVALDLHELAKQTDHLGHLARYLLLLEEPESNPERSALIEEAWENLGAHAKDPRWQLLHAETIDQETIIRYLKTSGHQLLRELQAQREEHSG